MRRINRVRIFASLAYVLGSANGAHFFAPPEWRPWLFGAILFGLAALGMFIYKVAE
jgi:hypothetical protein